MGVAMYTDYNGRPLDDTDPLLMDFEASMAAMQATDDAIAELQERFAQ